MLFKAVMTYLSHKPLAFLSKKFWDNLKNNQESFYIYSKVKDYPESYQTPKFENVSYIANSSLLLPNYFANNPLDSSGKNVGNYVFTRAMERYLTTPENYPLTKAEPKKDAHTVIIACANLLFDIPDYINQMKQHTEMIKKSRAKFFFIGLGAQFDINCKIKYSYNFKRAAKEFIKTVLDSGGAFGLRGYFTAEVFEKLGFHEYEVTGCPSMYVNGRDFTVSNEKVSPEDFRPVMHDHEQRSVFNLQNNKIFKNNPNLIYICQDSLFDYIYKNKPIPINDEYIEKMFNDDKIKLFLTIDEWIEEIKKYNFEFGDRFHGAALAITQGIPAFISPPDSRVKEMCEFFKIPHRYIEDYSTINLYELYLETDYSEFNKNYNKNYDNFAAFFEKHKIPNLIGKRK